MSLDDSLAAYFADELVDDLNCVSCQKKTTFSQRKRFITYPKVLGIFIRRQVYDDWVPKKLEIDFVIDSENTLDFEKFRGNDC